jgi:hypothetical protein
MDGRVGHRLRCGAGRLIADAGLGFLCRQQASEIVSGTGAYAGLKGHGTFLIVVDTSTNQLIGTEEGQVN